MLLLWSTMAQATNFTIDEITYTVINETTLTVEAIVANRNITEANIPATVTFEEITYKVTAIATRAFYNCQYLTTVSIPEGVTTIGDYAFYNCSALTEVIIPEGTTTIGMNAFSNCSALKTVTIPKSLKSVGDGAFSGCTSITTVNISDLTAWCNINFSDALTAAEVRTHHATSNPLYNGITSVLDEIYGGWTRSYYEPRDLVLNGEKIVDLVIPANVYHIAAHFCGCSAESISFEHTDEDIPSGIWGLTIRAESFSGMTNLKKVILPDCNTDIGGAAFIGCNNLEELTICRNYEWESIDNVMSYYGYPDEVETFQGCTRLKKLTIKEGVNTLEDIFGLQFSNAGLNPQQLEVETLNIPDLETIEPNIRANTINYTNETAWYNSTLDLMQDCEVLIAGVPVKEKSGELVIPDGVKYIYGEKFNKDITKVLLPNSVEKIYEGAFAGCTALSEINIPSSITFIGKGAFDNTAIYNNCTEELLYIDNWLVAYKSDNLGDIAIKEGTKGIANTLFAGCTHLTGVEFPNSISEIENEAFNGCTALKNIDFGQSISQIGYSAFEGCTALTSIAIPKNVTQINDETFRGCTSLAEIGFHKGITKIGSNAFENTAWYNNHTDGLLYLNNWLIGYKGDFAQESLIVEEGTVGIADNAAFSGLSNVVLPQSLAYIGEYAFNNPSSGCTFISHATTPPAIEEYSIPDANSYTLRVSIGKGIIEAYKANDHWNSFKNIVAKNTIGDFEYTPVSEDENTVAINQYFGNNANVVIPESIEINREVYDVTTINEAVFYNNTTLANITIPGSVTVIGASAFYGCTALTKIDLPDGITSIGASAFYGCEALTNIDLPDGITSIGRAAFRNCTALTRVYIPESVTSLIRGHAFSGCENLSEVYSNSETPATLTLNTFESTVLSNATLYIPIGSSSTYKGNKFWGRFSNIVEMDFTGIDNIEADKENIFNGAKDLHYDLNGRIAENPTRGIYILNGKKVMIK